MKSDKTVQRDVLDELGWDASIDETQIGVTAHEGIVTLSGHVLTHSDKHTAEKLTERVHGVKAIANEIEVRPSERHQRDDEDIAMAAVHALEWAGKVPSDRIKVVVSEGWITLDGTTDHRFEREAAERTVRHLVGVRGVTNSIRVEPAIARTEEQKAFGNIKDAIESALRRRSIVNSEQIGIEVSECVVTLTGDVRSYLERDEVERIAWMAPGISQVDNCITVTPWGSGAMEEWGY